MSQPRNDPLKLWLECWQLGIEAGYVMQKRVIRLAILTLDFDPNDWHSESLRMVTEKQQAMLASSLALWRGMVGIGAVAPMTPAAFLANSARLGSRTLAPLRQRVRRNARRL